MVIRSCGGCHVRDENGRMGRLSYMRKTPEGMADLDPPHGRAAQRAHRAGRGARGRALPGERAGARARGARARALRGRAAHRRLQLRAPRDRADVQRLPFHGAHHHRAAHEGRVEAAHRHAPRALPVRRLPGVPRQPAAAPGGQGHRAPVIGVPARDAEWSAWSANVRPPRLEGVVERWPATTRRRGRSTAG
jgi:hypothetical protein